MGRALLNNIVNLGALDAYREAGVGPGLRPAAAPSRREPEAGLGNGGLGRLAACFLDSAATLGPAVLRLRHPVRLRDLPASTSSTGSRWRRRTTGCRYGNPWEIPRPTRLPCRVQFGEHHAQPRPGRAATPGGRLVDAQVVYAMAYDTPILGYRNDTVNYAAPVVAPSRTREFDLARLQRRRVRARGGGQERARERSARCSTRRRPATRARSCASSSSTSSCRATLQDMLRRFRKRRAGACGGPAGRRSAIQLNDTHPALAIPELMRVLVDQDERGLGAAPGALTQRRHRLHEPHDPARGAWRRGRPTCSSGCCRGTSRSSRRSTGGFGGRARPIPRDVEREMQRMAIVDDPQHGRAWPTSGSSAAHSVNGVAALHTELLKSSTFAGLPPALPGPDQQQDERHHAPALAAPQQPGLASLITEAIGDGWTQRPGAARAARAASPRTPSSARSGRRVKRANKTRLAAVVHDGIGLGVGSRRRCSTCQVKRIHEYKRQLLNALARDLATCGRHDGTAGGAAPRACCSRQGGAGLRDRQADHPVRRRGGEPGQQRPARRAAGWRVGLPARTTTVSLAESASFPRASCPSRSRPRARRPRARAT